MPEHETYAYSASKAGMHHLSRHLAGRLGWEGITSNTLACGMYFFSPSDRIPDLTRLSFQARSIPRVNHFIMTVILMLTVCFSISDGSYP